MDNVSYGIQEIVAKAQALADRADTELNNYTYLKNDMHALASSPEWKDDAGEAFKARMEEALTYAKRLTEDLHLLSQHMRTHSNNIAATQQSGAQSFGGGGGVSGGSIATGSKPVYK